MTLFSLLGLVFLLLLGLYLRMLPARDVFVGGNVYFTDPDCYSRMTRVQMTVEHPFRRIDFHDFENHPDGVHPHTTAPFDYVIAGLSIPMRAFSNQSIAMAGAFVGPILWVLATVYLWGWCRAMNLRYRWMLLYAATVSPILVHGYAVGRPDHQCLILFFLTITLTSEWTLWRKPGRGWAIANGLAWGFALWTSLYEPLVLFAAVLLLRAVFLNRALKHRAWLESFGAAILVLVAGLLFDGIRIPKLPKETLEYFQNWSLLIAEMRPMTLDGQGIIRFTGWLLIAAPVLLVIQGIRGKSREAFALAALVLLTAGLTLWQQRWGYFVALTFAISLPWAMQPLKFRWIACALFIFSLGPMAREWEPMIYPNAEHARYLAEKRKDAVLLRDAATHLISPQKTPILAPWWLSPAFRYWSGQPCVAGSSHQSLPGTVDSARFYLATNANTAKEVLDRRGVRYVVAYEPSRAVGNSAALLKQAGTKNVMGNILYTAPHLAPPFLKLVYTNEFFKVYAYEPAR